MQKKQNKSLLKFVDFKRFTLIIPAIFLAIAMLVFAIWGVNNGMEYKDSHTFNIHFNTTVSSKDFKTYQDIITNTIANESNEKYSVVITRANDDITSQCKVNVYADNMCSEDVIEDLTKINSVIETKLNQVLQQNLVRITDVQLQKAQSYGSILLTGILSLVVLMAVAFVYYLLRFELKTALSSLIVAPCAFIMMLSIMTIFRLPFTDTFMLPALFSAIIGYILFTVIFDYIRMNLENKENALTNENLLYTAIEKNSTLIIALISSLSLIFVLLTFLFNTNTLLLCVSLLLAIVVAVFSSIILPGTVWTMIYNKEKDNKLKAKIQLLEARENKKNAKKEKDENNAVV